jgi:hypothetical protein
VRNLFLYMKPDPLCLPTIEPRRQKKKNSVIHQCLKMAAGLTGGMGSGAFQSVGGG